MSPIIHPGRLDIKRGVFFAPGSVTFNPVQTDQLIKLLPKLGIPAHSVAPNMGFNHPNPEIPVIGQAQMTGNKLRSQSRTGNGVRHQIGAGMQANLSVTMGYSDAQIELPFATRDQWARTLTAISIDALLARIAAEAVLNTEEAEFVTACWGTGLWTTQYLTGTVTKWNDVSSDPVAQINTAKRAVQKQCGQVPNHLLIPGEVADALAVNEVMRSYIGGGQGGPANQRVSYDDFAGIFKIEKVTVSDRIQNNASDLVEANMDLNFSITDGALLFVDDGADPVGGSALCRSYFDSFGIEGAATGVVIDSGEDQKARTLWRNIMRYAGYTIRNAKAGAFFEDLL